MTRVADDVLVVVLDAVEFPDHLVVPVVEPDQRDHLTLWRPDPGVGPDVLEHGLPHRSRPVLEVLFLPDSVER